MLPYNTIEARSGRILKALRAHIKDGFELVMLERDLHAVQDAAEFGESIEDFDVEDLIFQAGLSTKQARVIQEAIKPRERR